MNSPRNRDFFADIQILYETRVSSPGNARNIIGFIVRSVHGNQYVRNFTRKGRGSVYGRFADIARKDDIVRVPRALAADYFADKNREHEFALSVNKLVVASELPYRAKRRTDRERMAFDKPLGNGYGKYIRLSRKPFYVHFHFVKPFAVNLVRKLGFGYDYAAYEYFVVLFFFNHFVLP